jgi:HNH endonuclease
MNPIAHPPSLSAAALPHASVTSSLELGEARQLRDALTALLRQEQAAMADFLIALADFDRQRGWEPLGHASLFAFLTVELHLSRSAAFWRLSAARLVQRFPEIIEPLRDGRLCLSTTAELAKVLTEENLTGVLPRYFRLSAREAAEVTAALLPRVQPPLRTVVTGLEPGPAFAATVAVPPAPAAVGAVPLPATRTKGAVLTSEPAPPHPARVATPRDDVEPLTADLRRLHVTVSRQFLAKLDAARDGLAHAIPGATAEQVLEAALDLLLEKQARVRGQVRRPRMAAPTPPPAPAEPGGPAPRSPESDDLGAAPVHRRTGPREAIPAAVRRAVWERDRGRCAWPLDSGGCCGSTHRLELDHVVPWSRGGTATADNLRLTCRRHNAVAARQALGERCVDRYAGARARAGHGAGPPPTSPPTSR